MQDKYRRPDEEKRCFLTGDIRTKYPNLFFDRFEWIGNPNAHFVIDDLSCKSTNPKVSEAIEGFELLCNGFVKVYSVVQLTKALEKLMLGSCRLGKTLFLFPGEGAQTVKSVFPQGMLDQSASITVPARRIKNPQTGRAIGTDLPWDETSIEAIIDTGELFNIIVVDDVIDTGKTIEDIRRKMIRYVNATWYAAALIIFSPLPYSEKENSLSSIKGYEKIFTSVVLQGEQNPVALNSLSSFVEGGEKTKRLVDKCLRQYVKPDKAKSFIDYLLQLKFLLSYN